MKKILAACKKIHLIQIFRNVSSLKMEPHEFNIDVPYGVLAAKSWNNDGKDVPILALHGWMDNAGTWDRLCPLLNKDHQIVAIDAPGHGLSSHPPIGLGRYFTDNLVTIHRILHYLKWDKVILMGHSMGGAAVMMYAAAIPEKVQKVISLDALKGVHIEAEDQPDLTASSLHQILECEEKSLTQAPRYSREELTQKLVKSYGQSLTRESAEVLLNRGARWHDDGTVSLRHSPMLKVRSTLSMTLEQQLSFYSRIACGCLVVKATASPFLATKEEVRRALNALNSSGRFVLEVVEGTHHVHLNDPEPVARAVNDFLNDVQQSKEREEKTRSFLASNL